MGHEIFLKLFDEPQNLFISSFPSIYIWNKYVQDYIFDYIFAKNRFLKKCFYT